MNRLTEEINALKREKEEFAYYYQQGYRNGYIDGQVKGINIAQNVIANLVRPIIIKCDNKELADSIISSIGGRK